MRFVASLLRFGHPATYLSGTFHDVQPISILDIAKVTRWCSCSSPPNGPTFSRRVPQRSAAVAGWAALCEACPKPRLSCSRNRSRMPIWIVESGRKGIDKHRNSFFERYPVFPLILGGLDEVPFVNHSMILARLTSVLRLPLHLPNGSTFSRKPREPNVAN